ncbi:ABC transporter permease [Candidatus Enterococcus ikei]|uniref:Putative hemin transport system permease protein HrtB n=1 Tax=Candidatus Enterococcus ikei TaxID=2815326 RepID=A0ABS3GXP5_9ENTE|nr:ABC transporter permease [Enterococcus sp. DIV0869a]MBO0440042.1 ABC transporter permease [Enterococcus sp. DIV0869a]
MFLGLEEMKYFKLRYTLVIGVIVSVAYVAFMLSGLANGLAQGVRQGVDKWEATSIVLSEDANKSLNASSLVMDDLNHVDAKQKEPLGQYAGALNKTGQNKETDKINISLFGVNKDSSIRPKLIEGRYFENLGEIIIPKNLVDKGVNLGDTVKIGKLDKELKVVGITNENSFSIVPLIYTSIDQWQELKFGKIIQGNQAPINGIIVRDTPTKDIKLKMENNDLAKYDIENFIQKLPGYSEQNLTLNAMIYFLFVITAAIIGIFIYVMTLQKISLFGVMKAQGISNGYIIKSIIAQTFILGVIGVAIGVVLTLLTNLILPAAMPFALDSNNLMIYSLVLIIVAVLGGVFSIRTVTHVDPMKAIGG